MNLTEKLWLALIDLKELICSNNAFLELFLQKDYKWSTKPQPNNLLAIHLKNNFPEVISSSLNEQENKQLSHYLSYLQINRDDSMAKVFLHVAQTLDGKIALNNGKSQWIGNMANRIHCHRIRALVDAVMVGGNTFRIDQPKLNVRHVAGKDPRIVVITGHPIHFYPNQTQPIIFTYNENLNFGPQFQGEMIFYPSKNNTIPTSFILKELKKRGINSILLEGGQQCIKQFITEKMIHQLEFHIAPMLFGSGMDAVRLDEIEEINRSILLKKPAYYFMDEELMIVSQNIGYGS